MNNQIYIQLRILDTTTGTSGAFVFSRTGPDSKNCNEYANECVRYGDSDWQCNSISVFVPCLLLSYI